MNLGLLCFCNDTSPMELVPSQCFLTSSTSDEKPEDAVGILRRKIFYSVHLKT